MGISTNVITANIKLFVVLKKILKIKVYVNQIILTILTVNHIDKS